MKGIWRTNAAGSPTWPNWKKFHDLGVSDFYVPALYYDANLAKFLPNKYQLSSAYRAGVNSQGFGFRIWRDPSNTSELDPERFAKACSDDMDLVGGVAGYMMDIEYHDPEFVRRAILAFRTYKPKGPLAWTMEPFQGGWFSDALIDAINNDTNFVCVPQNYYGNMKMATAYPYTALKADLTSKGVSSNRVKVFYDVALTIPGAWDGCLFAEERL
jgi:hypothetical protein